MNTKDNFLLKFRKVYIFMAALILAALAISASLLSYSAEALTAPDYLPLTGVANRYHYFEAPYCVFSEGGNVYALDKTSAGNVLSVFSDTGKKLKSTPVGDNVSKIFVYNEIIYAIEDGNITSYTFVNSTLAAKTSVLTCSVSSPSQYKFDDIFVTEYNLIILSGGKVHIFNKSTLLFEETLSFLDGIKMFTLYNNTLYALKETGFNLSQIYFFDFDTKKSGLALEDASPCYAISPSDKGVSVLTASGIESYSKGINMLNFTAKISSPRALQFCYSGGNYYVLNGYKTIVKLSSDFSKSEDIVLSSGADLGFYHNPSSVSSRFGRIIVTDKGNNRVVINDGKTLKEYTNGLLAPQSSCTDDEGLIYIANSENKIAVFNTVDGNMVFSSNNKVEFKDTNSADITNVSISVIKSDSKNNLLILSADGLMYLKRPSETVFKQILNETVYALDSPFDADFTYVAVNGVNGKAVKKLNIGQSGATLSEEVSFLSEAASGFLDLASDGSGGFYALFSDNTIKRYILSGVSYVFSGEHTISNALMLKKISVSNIDFDDANDASIPDYRDILSLDALTHTVKTVPCSDFGVTYPDPSVIIKKAEVSGKTLTDAENIPPVLRTINNPSGCNVYAQNSEVKIIAVLPDNFKVIVQDYDSNAPYTKIIADFITGTANDEPIIGYVRTAYLSEPLPYTAPPVSICHIWTDNISIYPVPSRQTTPYISIATETLKLKNFAKNGESYGYRDNFPDNAYSKTINIWYRVEYEKGGILMEGFVIASTVSLYGDNPDLNIRPQVNAMIVAKDKNEPDTGAKVYYYNEQTKEYLLAVHEFNYLEVGTEVEVVGTFNPSAKYTLIKYFTQYGTIEGFVETENIKYSGVSLAQIIAVIIITIVLIIVIILVVRKLRFKKRIG